ncbi:hypothetical protein [Egbenema bharatensis]|uniref:hypothetical protein n=1 Tax=Egbenema bharatensis TaxID=3463334 RepID=UPI003A8A7F59
MKKIAFLLANFLIFNGSAAAFPSVSEDSDIEDTMDLYRVNIARNITTGTYYVRRGYGRCTLTVSSEESPQYLYENLETQIEYAVGSCFFPSVTLPSLGALPSQTVPVEATIATTSNFLSRGGLPLYLEVTFEMRFPEYPDAQKTCGIWLDMETPTGKRLSVQTDRYSGSCDDWFNRIILPH